MGNYYVVREKSINSFDNTIGELTKKVKHLSEKCTRIN